MRTLPGFVGFAAALLAGALAVACATNETIDFVPVVPGDAGGTASGEDAGPGPGKVGVGDPESDAGDPAVGSDAGGGPGDAGTKGADAGSSAPDASDAGATEVDAEADAAPDTGAGDAGIDAESCGNFAAGITWPSSCMSCETEPNNVLGCECQTTGGIYLSTSIDYCTCAWTAGKPIALGNDNGKLICPP